MDVALKKKNSAKKRYRWVVSKNSRRGMPVESPPSTSQRRRFADENHWDREDFSFDVFDFANRLKDGFRYLYELLNWWNLKNHSTSRYSKHLTKLTLRFISDSIYSLEVFPPRSFGNFPLPPMTLGSGADPSGSQGRSAAAEYVACYVADGLHAVRS